MHEAAQALKSLKSADDYLLNYKTQATASAVNLQKTADPAADRFSKFEKCIRHGRLCC